MLRHIDTGLIFASRSLSIAAFDENPCAFIDNKDLERLLEKKIFNDSSLVDGSGLLEY